MASTVCSVLSKDSPFFAETDRYARTLEDSSARTRQVRSVVLGWFTTAHIIIMQYTDCFAGVNKIYLAHFILPILFVDASVIC